METSFTGTSTSTEHRGVIFKTRSPKKITQLFFELLHQISKTKLNFGNPPLRRGDSSIFLASWDNL